MKRVLLPLLAFALGACTGPGNTSSPGALRWEPVDVPPLRESSMRGLSIPSDEVLWVSGNGGSVAVSADGGATWRDASPDVAQRDSLDLRSIWALDDERCWVASSGLGSASRILKTTDGGRTWRTVHTNRDADGFFDALAFWDAQRGLLMGDAVDGYLTLLLTEDAGETWARVPRSALPEAIRGEAGFAASNRSISLVGDRRGWIGTGGSAARVLRTVDGGRSWAAVRTPMRQGDGAAGIFALAFQDELVGLGVGGKYTEPEARYGTVILTEDGGKSWILCERPPGGFRSAVAPLPKRPGAWIAVGINGTDVSLDGGLSWSPIGTGRDTELNAVMPTPSGDAVWAVGPLGTVRRMQL